MSVKFLGLLAGICGLLLSVAPLAAHHSFAAEFDQNKSVTLTGAVTKIEWLNPHIYVYIDVKDAEGKVANWGLEGGPPNTLYRQGWRKDTLKLGDTITVEAFRAKDASNTGSIRTVTTSEGRRVFAGNPAESAPK